MSARLIDGKAIAAATRAKVAQQVAALTAQGKPVHLAAVLVGHNSAARVYAENQAKSCSQVGIQYRLHELPAEITQRELLDIIAVLNCDPAVTGIFLHTPLPSHLDVQRTQYALDILKDVEGVNPANIGHVFYGHTIIAPCTAVAVVELIESTGTQLQGAEVVIVGASRIVGRPTALLLTARDATVTVCQIHTRDLAAHTKQADILIVAVGKPGLITARHVKPGAVVIDVGINRLSTTDPATGQPITKTVGDVDFDSVAPLASWITPVPGGVGPVTVATLLTNTLRAAKLVYGLEQPFGGS
ncbi:MAG: bifunctional 5,10-methylenetetrahydrofolate dehydrogenase/5,10-methenyltetrahydrofolate cyclohydrolase [Phycisphaerae bacterium]